MSNQAKVRLSQPAKIVFLNCKRIDSNLLSQYYLWFKDVVTYSAAFSPATYPVENAACKL